MRNPGGRAAPHFFRLRGAFPALSAIEEGYDVFVATDGSGAFSENLRPAVWSRMAEAGPRLMTWFAIACEPHRG